MSAPRPSVTAVVATHDRPELLASALESIAAQRLPPEEVRIADDGELPLAPPASGAPRVVVLRTGAGQPGEARNRAAHGVSTTLLAFLDDDDRWLPGHLEKMVAAFDDPSLAFAYSDCAVIRERVTARGAREEIERRALAVDWSLDRERRDHLLPPSAWVVRRALFERLGGFDPTIPFTEDWDFVLRAAGLTTPRRVPGVTAEIRLREAGHLSQERGPERQACLDRIAARHGFAPPKIRDWWEVAGLLERESRSG